MRTISSLVSARSARSTRSPSSRASMNSTCPHRSIDPCLPAALSLAKNHRHTGIPVLRNSWVGNATMQETKSASTICARISPSPLEFDDIDPLAITTPARPPGANLYRMC
ncbi:Uncharacterised protein [Mycobacterium tuberculosis]|nr:Uncharacterised protein [Mycobacterium tuberculosis]